MHNYALLRKATPFHGKLITMAIEYFRLKRISRRDHPEGTYTQNHAKYIMRRSASCEYGTANMPKQYHAALRDFAHEEQNLRKNAVIEHRVVAAIPNEMNAEQAAETLRLYASRISNRYDQKQDRWLRARCLWSLHTDNPENVHAHIILRDRDVTDGKSRVFGVTAYHGMDRLKDLFFQTCNEKLEEFGIEARIVRKRDRVQALSAEMEIVPAEEMEAPPLSEEPSTPLPEMQPEAIEEVLPEPEQPEPGVAPEVPAEALPETEDIGTDDGSIPDEDEPVSDPYEGWTPAERIRDAYGNRWSLNRLNEIRQDMAFRLTRIEALRKSIEYSEKYVREAQATAERAKIDALNADHTYHRDHTGIFGRMKGFGLKVGKLSLKTSARMKAEMAYSKARTLDGAAIVAEDDATSAVENLALAKIELQNSKRVYSEARQELATRFSMEGTAEEIEAAKLTFEDREHKALDGIVIEQIERAMDDGDLTADEYRYARRHLGYGRDRGI